MVSHHDHHRHSAYLMAHVDAPGFSQSQQRRIADLVLGQRGGLRKLETALAQEGFAWQVLCLRLAVIACHARESVPRGRAGAARGRRRGPAWDGRPAGPSAAQRTHFLLQEEAAAWQRHGPLRLQLPAAPEAQPRNHAGARSWGMIADVKPRPRRLSPSCCSWTVRAGDGWSLVLQGDWRAPPGRWARCRPRLNRRPAAGSDHVSVDARGAVSSWDTDTAPQAVGACWPPLRRAGVRHGASARLPDALRSPRWSWRCLPEGGGGRRPADGTSTAPARWTACAAWGQDALTTAAFLGEVALALGRLLRGKTVMRGSDYVRQLDLCRTDVACPSCR